MGTKTLKSGYKAAILSTAYMGPVQYFTKFILYPKAYIEQHETYLKQSYRNRCYIYGTNGKMTLIIPVKKINRINTKTKDILIDYDTNWQRIHWNSIVSAYRSSPFFEFYEDDLRNFYSDKEKTLLDFNQKILLLLLGFLDIDIRISLTDSFQKKYVHEMDLRECINPKKRLARKDNRFVPYKYNQVFIEKHGFIPNLSIIDLLFNEGPNTLEILRKCIK
jgi:hypothetical protein